VEPQSSSWSRRGQIDDTQEKNERKSLEGWRARGWTIGWLTGFDLGW
jgi:hypothetical protein